MPEVPVLDFVLPILGAVVAGALIGFEREYRGRPAGLRTHILVSLASALLMLAAVHQIRWLTDTPAEVIRIDPVRMAHGVLTGVGFLCGGVIFRQGLSVHGLTTAASLWITASIGLLYGIGYYGLAIGGTAATLAVLILLRWVEGRLPKLRPVDVAVRYRRPDAPTEAGFLALARELAFSCSPLTHRLVERGAVVEFRATFHGSRPGAPEALARRLAGDPAVLEFEIAPRND